MFCYTNKEKMPKDAVFLAEEAEVYGELYLGSTLGLIYLDEEKRLTNVPICE